MVPLKPDPASDGQGSDSLTTIKLIGHFQVPKTLNFKWGQVQNLSCENELYLHENKKIIFILKALLSGLETWGSLQMAYSRYTQGDLSNTKMIIT